MRCAMSVNLDRVLTLLPCFRAQAAAVKPLLSLIASMSSYGLPVAAIQHIEQQVKQPATAAA